MLRKTTEARNDCRDSMDNAVANPKKTHPPASGFTNVRPKSAIIAMMGKPWYAKK
jgi:hypothetical protein